MCWLAGQWRGAHGSFVSGVYRSDTAPVRAVEVIRAPRTLAMQRADDEIVGVGHMCGWLD